MGLVADELVLLELLCPSSLLPTLIRGGMSSSLTDCPLTTLRSNSSRVCKMTNFIYFRL